MAPTTALQSPTGAFSGAHHSGSDFTALAGATAVLRIVRTWRQRARSRHSLATLSDHMLHDIGLSRGEALNESGKWFWRG